MLIEIINDGPDIKSTNYWATPHAKRGLLYLSGNAGHWRLLVPEAAEEMMLEMSTGRAALIEPSIHSSGHIDIVFDDGTDTPFQAMIDRQQTDRALENKADCVLTVWNERGKVLTLPCEVKGWGVRT